MMFYHHGEDRLFYVGVLTWGWDSDGRVDPPRWLRANSDGGAFQSSVGQVRQNSAEEKCDKKRQ